MSEPRATVNPHCKPPCRRSDQRRRKTIMLRWMQFIVLSSVVVYGAAAQQPAPQQPAPQQPAAQQPAAQQPTFETRKITDNVYMFRYVGHQSMFVVTPEGVIATDPISYLRPQAAQTYIAEIRKITNAPIKYVVYSHHHYDHVAGGRPFKELGATFVAHRNAKAHLEQLKFADVVMPDVLVDDKYVIELGGVRVELYYVGRHHSDNSLAMLVPKDKILFTVDFVPIETVHWRDMPDGFLPDWFD